MMPLAKMEKTLRETGWGGDIKGPLYCEIKFEIPSTWTRRRRRRRRRGRESRRGKERGEGGQGKGDKSWIYKSEAQARSQGWKYKSENHQNSDSI